MKRPPKDYDFPEWGNANRVHDWKNHVPIAVREEWLGFYLPQRAILAQWAEELADTEEWD